MPDSEVAVGAVRTYQEWGHCEDGMHHLYATGLGGHRLSQASAINVVITPFHWIMDLNVRLDAATQEPSEVDLPWLLRRPFSFLPLIAYWDQCHLYPTALVRQRSDMRPVVGRTTRRGVASPLTGSTVTSSAVYWRTVWTTSRR